MLSDRPLGPHALTYPSILTPVSETQPTRTPGELTLSSIEALIETYTSAFDVRASLVRAMIQVESAFNARARSPKGAMGLMQLMPATAAELGVHDPYNPEENIRAGVTYLKQLLARFDQNEELALAAYNAGAGAVERYGMKVPPYPETRLYLQRLRELTRIIP